jgi:hypothetical protein
MKAVFAAAALLGCTVSVSAQTITVIYSEIVGDPTSLVPAGADVPAGTVFDSFDRPYRSPDGLSWIISASTDLATTEDEIIIVGAGVVGATVVREGTAFGSPTVGENCGLINRNLGIADGGQYAFSMNSDGPTGADEYVVLFDGVDWLTGAREGDPVPTFPTEVYGATLDSANILNDGVTVAFRAPSTVGDLGSDFDDFLVQGPLTIAQEGTTIPLNQEGGALETWDNFDTSDFYVSADGLHFVAQGDLSGDTTGDDVVVVNNSVIVQEGSVLAGSGFLSPVGVITETIAAFNNPLMNPTVFVRGDNADDRDWVTRYAIEVIADEQTTVAVRGEPIVLGTQELFDDTVFSATFFWLGGDSNGNYVIGGTTSNPDENADAVLVLNGTTVLARQGDPVDLDGNGINDDDTFINIFNNDDGFLTDDGILYFTATINDSAGTDLGQAFMRLDTTAIQPCLGDIEPVPANGVVNVMDLLLLLDQWGMCPMPCETGCTGDLNGDCIINVMDLLILLDNWGPCP